MKLKLSALALIASMIAAPAFAGANDYDPAGALAYDASAGFSDLSAFQADVTTVMGDASVITAAGSYYNQQVAYIGQVGASASTGNYAIIDQTADGGGDGNYAVILQDSQTNAVNNVAVIAQLGGANHAVINQR